MGYQVIATPAFTGAGLPPLAPPGFADNFNRPDSTSLGVTSTGGRPWRFLKSVPDADIVPQVKDQQLASVGSVGYVLGYAEAHAADALVEATISFSDPASVLTPNLRIVARAASAAPAEFASVRWQNTPGNERVILDTYGPVRRTEQSAVLGDLTGRRIGLKAQGDTFTVYADGVQVISPATALGVGAGVTRHGFQASNSSNTVRLDDLTVTPI